MSYTIMATQPAVRAAGIPDSQIAPGLYPNEVAVTLDTGQGVAVYVEALPVDNNAGIAYYASARAINADGSTVMHGTVQMVTEYPYLSSQNEVAQLGATPLAQGMLLIVLGEPLQTGTMDGETVTIPQAASFAVASASIRTMLAASTTGANITTSGVLPSPSPMPTPTPTPSPVPSPT